MCARIPAASPPSAVSSSELSDASTSVPWNTRSSASWLSTMIMIRRFIGLRGLSLSYISDGPRPITRTTFDSFIPPATSSRRDAFARSADSSQFE